LKTYDIRPTKKIESRPETTVPEKIPAPDQPIRGEIPKKTQSGRNSLPWKKIIISFLALVMLMVVGYSTFLVFKFKDFNQKINPKGNSHSTIINTIKTFTTAPKVKLAGADGNRINVLLLGIAGTGKPGQNLTDTILIASINPETYQVSLMSLPRDLFVNVPGTRYQTKLNSIYQMGLNDNGNDTAEAIELLKKTIEEITGQEINYYAILNFDGFEKIINDVDGVNVMNERDILDNRYPGPNYSYETFELAKGFHHLDGATALKYVRTRHNDPEGDFGRAKRQQQVMQSVKNSVFSAKTLLNVFAVNDLFNTVGDNLKTNITLEETDAFLELSKKLDTNNINNVVVDAWQPESLLKVSHINYGNLRAFVLIPRVSGYQEVRELAANIFDLNQLKRRKEEIAKEEAMIAVINLSSDAGLGGKVMNLLKNRFGYKKAALVSYPTKLPSENTLIYDLTGGTKPFSVDELIKKLPAHLSGDGDPILDGNAKLPAGTNLVIVIGKDLEEFYNMDEDSVDEWKNSQADQEYFQPIEKANSGTSN